MVGRDRVAESFTIDRMDALSRWSGRDLYHANAEKYPAKLVFDARGCVAILSLFIIELMYRI